MPYPAVIQFETMRRAVKAELALPSASEAARRAARRLDLRVPMALRTVSGRPVVVTEASDGRRG
jgi:hypothetical protein